MEYCWCVGRTLPFLADSVRGTHPCPPFSRSVGYALRVNCMQRFGIELFCARESKSTAVRFAL